MEMQKSDISADSITLEQREAEEEMQELRDALTAPPMITYINLDEIVNRIICSAMEEKSQDECLTSEQQKKLFDVVSDRIKVGNVFANLIQITEDVIADLTGRISVTLNKFFSNPSKIRGGLFGHVYREAVGETPGLVSCRVKDIEIETNVVLKKLIDVDITLFLAGKPAYPSIHREVIFR
jgi:hypothetical protein